MVTLTTPLRKEYYTGEEWRDIEDYSGWEFLLHPIQSIALILLKALYVIFGSYAAYYIGLLGIFIIGLVRG